MGNKLGPDTQISYKTLLGQQIVLKLGELSGEQNYPTVPKDKYIIQMYADWLKNVKLDARQKEMLESLPLRYKYRLCIEHDKKVKAFTQKKEPLPENLELSKEKRKELEFMIQTGLSKPISYHTLVYLKVLKFKDDLVMDIFVELDGIEILLTALEKFEVKSRTSGNHATILTLIKIFDLLVSHEKTMNLIATNAHYFNAMASLIHPIHIEITCRVLWQFGSSAGFCWHSETCVVYMMDALKAYQERYSMQNKFEILMNIIFHSDNLLMVMHLLQFLLNLVGSIIDKDLRRNIIRELYETKIDQKKLKDVFKSVEQAIQNNNYQLESCTLESQQEQLAGFVHPLADLRSIMHSASILEVDHQHQFKNHALKVHGSDKSQSPTTPQARSSINPPQRISLLPSEVNLKAQLIERLYLTSEETNLFEFVMENSQKLIHDILNIEDIIETIEEDLLPKKIEEQKSSIGKEDTSSPSRYAKQEKHEESVAEDQLSQLLEKNRIIQKDYDQLSKLKQELQLQNDQLRQQLAGQLILQPLQVIDVPQELPTPNPQMGGPPPPPPPGGPPPPPPPGGAPPPPMMGEKQKEKVKQSPSVAMKPLNWTVLPQSKVKGTIFESMDDTKVSLEINALQDLFQKSVMAPMLETRRKTVASIQKITLLSAEKSKSIEIVLQRLKLPFALICRALLTCDQVILKPSVLESLDAICPNEEEVLLLANYEGDKHLLGNPELFVDEIRKVNGFTHRIKALKFVNQEAELYLDLRVKLNQLRVFDQLRQQRRIHLLFEQVLAVGNYMNGQSNRGGAWGFKIDIVEKANDVKAADNKRTLMMYILKRVEHQLQQPFFASEDEISNEIEPISKIPISQLTLDLQEIRKGLKSMERARAAKKDADQEDQIDTYLEQYEADIRNHILEIEDKIASTQEAYQRTAQYYGESGTDSSEKFGEKMVGMFNGIMKAKKETIKQDLQHKKEEEAIRREEDKKSRINMSQRLPTPVIEDDVIEIDQHEIQQDQSNEQQSSDQAAKQPEDLKVLRNQKMNRTTDQSELQKQFQMIQARRASYMIVEKK